MQLNDRVSGLEQKHDRTRSVLSSAFVLLILLLVTDVYQVLRPEVSFDNITIGDVIEIGNLDSQLTLGRSMLRIVDTKQNRVVLSPGLLDIGNTRLTSDELHLSTGPSMLVAKISDTESRMMLAYERQAFSVSLGGPGLAGVGVLRLPGNQDELISAQVGDGLASIMVSNSASEVELSP